MTTRSTIGTGVPKKANTKQKRQENDQKNNRPYIHKLINSHRAQAMSNPLVDRILHNPLTFVSAKTPEKEVQTIKSAGYIVLNSLAAASHAEASDHHMAAKNLHGCDEKRPKSMAEAIAAYTGRKYLTVPEKKRRKERLPRPVAKHELPQEHELQQLAKPGSESSEDEARYESASEFTLDASFHGLRDTSEGLGESASGSGSGSGTESGNESGSENSSEETINDEEGLETSSGLESPASDSNVAEDEHVTPYRPVIEAEHDEDAGSAESLEDDDEEFNARDSIDESIDYSESKNDEEESETQRENQSDKDEEEEVEEGHSDGVHRGTGGVITHLAYQTSNDDDEDEDESLGQNNQDRLQLRKDLLLDMEKSLSDEAEEANGEYSNGTSRTRSANGNGKMDSNGPNNAALQMSTHYTLSESESEDNTFSVRILRKWTPPYKLAKPVGLLNFGVTCYMNSAIQIMVHIPAMQHYLIEVMQGKHASIQPRSVTHTFAELALRMWEVGAINKDTPRKYINPKKMVQRLTDINCMMSEWQQEDSHEYFMSLMARLQEDSTPKGQKLNQSIIHDIFGGLLDQEVVCQTCRTSSVTKQEFYDLSLGLNKKRTKANNDKDTNTDMDNEHDAGTKAHTHKYTIDRSLRDFFSTETIRLDSTDTASGYFCEHCHKRTVATKKSAIEQSPHTLMIHLKRFKFTGNSSLKVKQPIHYLKFLDLSSYSKCRAGGGAIKYQLMGVIVHEGRSILSGHYVAHCYQPDGTWSTYDDEYMNKIDEATALRDPSAYCLVYLKMEEKATERALSDDANAKRQRIV